MWEGEEIHYGRRVYDYEDGSFDEIIETSNKKVFSTSTTSVDKGLD